MSKNNKVNRDHYVQRGRLTPDEAAREMAKQRLAASPKKVEGSKFGEADEHQSKQRVTEKDNTREDEEETQ